jgi:hypothetical protein
MTTNQEQMIEAAARALLERAQSDVVTPAELSGDMAEMCRELAQVAVAAIHPTVTSVQEANDLPKGTTILDAEGWVMHLKGRSIQGWWYIPGDERDYAEDEIALPATVLHMGGAA